VVKIVSAEFTIAAKSRGLIIDRVIADGKIHRVPVDGRAKSERPGWYVFNAPGNARAYGAFGRWDDGLDGDNWCEGIDSTPPTKAELAAINEARKRANEQRESDQANAAKKAAEVWDKLSLTGDAPYLKRKAVTARGVRFDGDSVLVPLRDIDNALWSLQRIAPDGAKRFHPGGRITGCFHLLGEVKDGAPLLIVEGYATGATLHEATGETVACAMNCHNLLPVGEALRNRYPKTRLIICADDDAKTAAKRGMNPGVKSAEDAATRLKCEWIKPVGLPEGATDFNDLAAAMGIDEVKAQLATLLDVTVNQKQSRIADVSKKVTDSIPNDNTRLPRFEVNDKGVWHHGTDKDGKATVPIWVCAPLRVTARTRDGEGGEWGYFLEFDDPEGNKKMWAMPARMLAGDGNEYRQNLLSLGLQIGTSQVSRERLTYYIQTRNPEDLARCTDRAGWHGDIFVMPDRTLGESNERVIFQSSGAAPNAFREAGALGDWKVKVSAPCVGNSRLLFAVSVALAGPTLYLSNMESGGFHFRGGSSSGKTTALRVAASVYGGKDFMQRWRATDNALEGLAAQHSDTVLILDEIAQVDPKLVGECAYLLSNGAGKARMGRTGTPRQSLKWRLFFLSAGEVGLSDHMAEVGKRTRAGQDIRMAEIPADAGKHLGLFEDLHGVADGARFANTLNANAARVYGVVGRMLIEGLASERDTASTFIKTKIKSFMERLRERGAEGQAQRVAARFAQVGAAGELASHWGLTGWPEGAALQAAERCFHAWLNARGGTGNAEERSMIRQVIAFLESNGDSRFTHYARAEKADDHMPNTVNRAGFKRFINEDESASLEYLVLAEAFKNDVCKGYDYREVARVLKRHGFIKTDSGRLQLSARLPMIGQTKCYLILPAIFDYEREGDSSDSNDSGEALAVAA
jgi:putative DNA primase/helicase